MNDENYDLNSLREKLNERVDEIKKHKDFLNCKYVISFSFQSPLYHSTYFPFSSIDDRIYGNWKIFLYQNHKINV